MPKCGGKTHAGILITLYGKWTPEQSLWVVGHYTHTWLLNMSFVKPRILICCYYSLHFSGKVFLKILEAGWKDFLPFSHKSMSEIGHWCRAIRFYFIPFCRAKLGKLCLCGALFLHGGLSCWHKKGASPKRHGPESTLLSKVPLYGVALRFLLCAKAQTMKISPRAKVQKRSYMAIQCSLWSVSIQRPFMTVSILLTDDICQRQVYFLIMSLKLPMSYLSCSGQLVLCEQGVGGISLYFPLPLRSHYCVMATVLANRPVPPISFPSYITAALSGIRELV